MAVDVPGMGEERGPSGGLELGRQETREVSRERGDDVTVPHLSAHVVKLIFRKVNVGKITIT